MKLLNMSLVNCHIGRASLTFFSCCHGVDVEWLIQTFAAMVGEMSLNEVADQLY
jgi:hypothetical protein